MTAEFFLDTNILVYAAVGSVDDRKKKLAFELIKTQKFATSAQVLQEFFVTVVKRRPLLSPRVALDWIQQLTEFPCLAIDHQLVGMAIELSDRYLISYWDAAIIAAAESLGCPIVYSEDLNDGQRYGFVRVVNPFLPRA
jgi:predicted nucleic acid-binding protein